MTSPAPRRGRPPKLSRADVVDAARAVVVAEGYDAVSVRRLAAELGVSTFAVHSHMGSRDELFDEVVMSLIDDRRSRTGKSASWQKSVIRYATDMWELLIEHPAVLEVLQRSTRAPQPVMADLDRMALLAEREGMSLERAADVYEVVWTFVLGNAALVHARAAIDEQAERTARAAVLQEELPHAAALASALAATDRKASFQRRLALLVDALGTTS